MPTSLSRTRRAVVGWCLIFCGIAVPLVIGFLNPTADKLQLLAVYDWVYGLAVASFFIGLPLALSE